MPAPGVIVVAYASSSTFATACFAAPRNRTLPVCAPAECSTTQRNALRFSIVFVSLVVAVAVNPVTTVITYCFTGGAAASLLTHRPFAPCRYMAVAAASNTHWALCRRKNSILTRGTRHRRRAKLRLEKASPWPDSLFYASARRVKRPGAEPREPGERSTAPNDVVYIN